MSENICPAVLFNTDIIQPQCPTVGFTAGTFQHLNTMVDTAQPPSTQLPTVQFVDVTHITTDTIQLLASFTLMDLLQNIPQVDVSEDPAGAVERLSNITLMDVLENTPNVLVSKRPTIDRSNIWVFVKIVFEVFQNMLLLSSFILAFLWLIRLFLWRLFPGWNGNTRLLLDEALDRLVLVQYILCKMTTGTKIIVISYGTTWCWLYGHPNTGRCLAENA